jgi:hypothetical protein
MGTGELRMIHSRMVWMWRPVDNHHRVAAQRMTTPFFTSSLRSRAMELPILALTWSEQADDHRLGFGMVDIGE